MAVKTCPKCREDNSEAAVICINCGTTLLGKDNAAADSGESNLGVEKREAGGKKSAKTNKFGIVLVVCFLIVCAVLLIINFTK